MSGGVYEITYRDANDGGCPTFTTRVRAHSFEHALEIFDEGLDSEGWRALSVARVSDAPRHRWSTMAVAS